MNDSFLSQEEIDALLQKKDETSEKEQEKPGKIEEETLSNDEEELTNEQKDALGEIANISMGSASTTLSQLLNQKVTITTPRVWLSEQEKLFSSFERPFVVVDVNFTEGLKGSNLLIIKVKDANVIADLMMGGDGSAPSEELNEMYLSAVGEAMNQMIGSAATAMSTIFQRTVSISPPQTSLKDINDDFSDLYNSKGEKMVVVSFKMEIGNLVNSEIMQVMPLHVAHEEADLLLKPAWTTVSSVVDFSEEMPAEGSSETHTAEKVEQEKTSQLEREGASRDKNLDLILDVPLRVSVILGRTRKSINDVLHLGPGAVIELDKLADEPVDILVNGTLIAHGEVVVVEENFGVRITSIVSPRERINNLMAK